MVLADLDIVDRLNRFFEEIFEWLPALVGAIAVLIIGYFVAKVVGNLVGRVLQRAGFDRTVQKGQGGTWVQRVTSSPSRLLGRIVFWVLFLGVVSIAVDVLGIEALENLVAAVWSYIPNILAAVLIFLVAGAIAAAVATFAQRTMGDTTTGKLISTVVPVLVMAIAGFMILDQLEIAPQIVTITYAALMGAIALGMALAFGLGGRDVATRVLEGAYVKGQMNVPQMKEELRQGRERAKEEAQRLRDKADSDSAPTSHLPPRPMPE
jgi:hypothetical protein